MMSAPRSPSSMAQYGPERWLHKSRTRRPSSAPAMIDFQSVTGCCSCPPTYQVAPVRLCPIFVFDQIDQSCLSDLGAGDVAHRDLPCEISHGGSEIAVGL